MSGETQNFQPLQLIFQESLKELAYMTDMFLKGVIDVVEVSKYKDIKKVSQGILDEASSLV